MGLDVGVMRINYRNRPVGAAYDFAWHLNHNSDAADWVVATGENTFVELTHETMLELERQFESENDLSRSDTEVVRSWVDGLPWNDGVIMLHLSW